MSREFTTVVIRDAKEPIQLGNLLLGGVISAAATGNLVEEQFRQEDAAIAGLGSQDSADQDRSRRAEAPTELEPDLRSTPSTSVSASRVLVSFERCARALEGCRHVFPRCDPRMWTRDRRS